MNFGEVHLEQVFIPRVDLIVSGNRALRGWRGGQTQSEDSENAWSCGKQAMTIE